MAETEEKKAKNDKPKKGFKKAKSFLAVGGGTLVGFINGFFGGGGGMLAVPLLDKVLKEETKKAHATAILVILPITIASAVFYILNGYFELKPTIFSSIGVIAGGIGGAFLLKVMPEKIVGIVFAVLMLAAGVKMVFFKN